MTSLVVKKPNPVLWVIWHMTLATKIRSISLPLLAGQSRTRCLHRRMNLNPVRTLQATHRPRRLPYRRRRTRARVHTRLTHQIPSVTSTAVRTARKVSAEGAKNAPGLMRRTWLLST